MANGCIIQQAYIAGPAATGSSVATQLDNRYTRYAKKKARLAVVKLHKKKQISLIYIISVEKLVINLKQYRS